MRIKVSLLALQDKPIVDFNHNYELAKNLKSVISKVNPRINFEKPQLYTFSRLMVKNKNFEIGKSGMKLLTNRMHFFFSSFHEHLCKELMEGLIENPEMEVCGVKFEVTGVEIIKEKKIKNKERFVTLSPISFKNFESLRNNTNLLASLIKKDLISKYRIAYSIEPENTEIKLKILRFKPVRIRLNNEFCKAALMVFDAGNKELMEIGYKAGFGQKNDMGFGMVKVVSSKFKKLKD